MVEWSKAHAWNVCVEQSTEGSNPSLIAIYIKLRLPNWEAIFLSLYKLNYKKVFKISNFPSTAISNFGGIYHVSPFFTG